MNLIDVIILIIFVPFVVRGIKLGFVVQAAAVVALVAGCWLAFHFAGLVSGWIAPVISGASPKALHTVAFVIILILAILTLHVIGKALQKVVQLALLGWLDRLLGGIFAAIKVILILGIFILLFSDLNHNYGWVDNNTLDGSLFYKPLKDLAYTIFPYFKGLFA